jgi:drug/metabolite transporter (DMT)-like permease
MFGRLDNAIVGVTIGLVAVALAGLVALLAKLIFKKSIGTPKYYSTVSGVLWVLMSAALLSVLPKTDTTESLNQSAAQLLIQYLLK